ncbi:MAG: ArgR family transcriptional regulator [Cognaticolwellia aestuarii]|jgi:transcriptional regulator of arginine metabolism
MTNNDIGLMNSMKVAEPELINTFKALLQDQRFGSQLQLARALSLRGFENVTQTRVSRLLHKVGAVKIRNHNNDAVYRLPEKQHIPCGQQAIDSVVLDIKHNQVQIIIKTVIGAATLISKMIESMGEQSGVLACMASDSAILVIPTDVERIQQTMTAIIEHVNLNR